jgi:hypothetical protein
MLRFFYNGIKGSDNNLQKCFYSEQKNGTIWICGKKYKDFSNEIRQVFQVENNTDMATDFFQNDSIFVLPEHPLYPQVFEAMQKAKAKVQKRAA